MIVQQHQFTWRQVQPKGVTADYRSSVRFEKTEEYFGPLHRLKEQDLSRIKDLARIAEGQPALRPGYTRIYVGQQIHGFILVPASVFKSSDLADLNNDYFLHVDFSPGEVRCLELV